MGVAILVSEILLLSKTVKFPFPTIIVSGYILERSKFSELLIFCCWQILIWRIGRHMSLSMCTLNENGGFNFGKW